MKNFRGMVSKLTHKGQDRDHSDGQHPISNEQQPINPNPSSGNGRIAWPPKLINTRVFGEVKDVSNRNLPRDFGRSCQLGDKTYYMFGDTFCFDDGGNFKGVTNNTIALVPNPQDPTKSQYLTPEPKVPEFVPLSHEEKAFGDEHTAKGENKRFVNWSFGGVLPVPNTDGREGWLFFDTVEIHGAEPQKGYGIGLAKATVQHDSHVKCERVGKFPLFPDDGPAWGNIANVAAPDGYAYLLSGKGLDNYMARIRLDADFADPGQYTFLKKGGDWVSNYNDLGELENQILPGQGQGAIEFVGDKGPGGRPYMWIGCEKFPTSKLFVGVADQPWGPWDVQDLGEMPKFHDQSNQRYCIYPHLWGSDIGKGEILLTWSDNGTMGGKVAAGVFTFATS